MKNLLLKLMPIDRAVALAMRFGLLAKPLEVAAKGWSKAQGVRTQGLLVVAGALKVASWLGWIPTEAVEPINLVVNTLLGAAVPTALKKVQRALEAGDKVAEAVAAKAAEAPVNPAPPAA